MEQFNIYKDSQVVSNVNFDTGDVANDETIKLTFTAKSFVSSVKYTQGSLKGTNGILVETQNVTPTLQQ